METLIFTKLSLSLSVDQLEAGLDGQHVLHDQQERTSHPLLLLFIYSTHLLPAGPGKSHFFLRLWEKSLYFGRKTSPQRASPLRTPLAPLLLPPYRLVARCLPSVHAAARGHGGAVTPPVSHLWTLEGHEAEPQVYPRELAGGAEWSEGRGGGRGAREACVSAVACVCCCMCVLLPSSPLFPLFFSGFFFLSRLHLHS